MKIDDNIYKYRKNYNANAYEQIKIQSRKEKRLNDMIKLASKKRNISASVYIVMAIEQLLSYDGITFDDLEMDDNNSMSDKRD